MATHDGRAHRPCRHPIKSRPQINDTKEWHEWCLDCMEKFSFTPPEFTELGWFAGNIWWILMIVLYGFLVWLAGLDHMEVS